MQTLKANVYLLKVQNKKLNMFRLSKQRDYLLLTHLLVRNITDRDHLLLVLLRSEKHFLLYFFQVHLCYIPAKATMSSILLFYFIATLYI